MNRVPLTQCDHDCVARQRVTQRGKERRGGAAVDDRLGRVGGSFAREPGAPVVHFARRPLRRGSIRGRCHPLEESRGTDSDRATRLVTVTEPTRAGRDAHHALARERQSKPGGGDVAEPGTEHHDQVAERDHGVEVIEWRALIVKTERPAVVLREDSPRGRRHAHRHARAFGYRLERQGRAHAFTGHEDHGPPRGEDQGHQLIDVVAGRRDRRRLRGLGCLGGGRQRPLAELEQHRARVGRGGDP